LFFSPFYYWSISISSFNLIYWKLVFVLFFSYLFYWVISIMWSWSRGLQLNPNWFIFFSCCFFNLNLFFIYFYHSTLSCSIIEFHDFIQISFECGHSNITTGSKVLNLDLRELKSSFFILFLVIFFLNICSSIFYFLEIKLQFFFWVIIFSYELSGIALRVFFLHFFLLNCPYLMSMIAKFMC